MGFLDKVKNFVAQEDEDVEFEEDYDMPIERTEARETERIDSSDKKNKVVNIHATTQLQVVLVKPERIADAQVIGTHLNNKKTVVLNLEAANKELSRRLIDFLSGVAFANNGQIKKVANSTYIITPFNVDIMGDMLIDELENSGMYI